MMRLVFPLVHRIMYIVSYCAQQVMHIPEEPDDTKIFLPLSLPGDSVFCRTIFNSNNMT